MAQQQNFSPEDPIQAGQSPKMYLETDIDVVRRDDHADDAAIDPDTLPPLLIDEPNVIPPPPNFCQGFEMKRFLEFNHNSPRYPTRSISLPRGINMVSPSCFFLLLERLSFAPLVFPSTLF